MLTVFSIVALRSIKASAGRLTARKMAYSRNANYWHFLRKGVSSLPYPWNYARLPSVLKRVLISPRGDA